MKSFFCLHGFLGIGKDWEFLREHGIVVAPDLNQMLRKIKPLPSIEGISQLLLNEAQQKLKNSRTRILIGYSMGGRLAVEVFDKNPEFFDELVLVSAGLGIASDEKERRLEFDKSWANRFATEPFDTVVKDWNQQPIFLGSKSEPLRQAQDYDTSILKHMLSDWSQAKQINRWDQLDKWQKSVRYIVGENDTRYVEFAKNVNTQNSRVKVDIIPGSGHRVIFDAREDFLKILGL